MVYLLWAWVPPCFSYLFPSNSSYNLFQQRGRLWWWPRRKMISSGATASDPGKGQKIWTGLNSLTWHDILATERRKGSRLSCHRLGRNKTLTKKFASPLVRHSTWSWMRNWIEIQLELLLWAQLSPEEDIPLGRGSDLSLSRKTPGITVVSPEARPFRQRLLKWAEK